MILIVEERVGVCSVSGRGRLVILTAGEYPIVEIDNPYGKGYPKWCQIIGTELGAGKNYLSKKGIINA
jgi:hypothetical protein